MISIPLDALYFTVITGLTAERKQFPLNCAKIQDKTFSDFYLNLIQKNRLGTELYIRRLRGSRSANLVKMSTRVGEGGGGLVLSFIAINNHHKAHNLLNHVKKGG